jgi:hypothetical protein
MSDFAMILTCYRSGQISARQWQAHLSDASFRRWLTQQSIHS